MTSVTTKIRQTPRAIAAREQLAPRLQAIGPVKRGGARPQPLPQRHRRARELHEAGYTYTEIAQELGYTHPKSVGYALRRAYAWQQQCEDRDRRAAPAPRARSPHQTRAELARSLQRDGLSLAEIAAVLGYSQRSAVWRLLHSTTRDAA